MNRERKKEKFSVWGIKKIIVPRPLGGAPGAPQDPPLEETIIFCDVRIVPWKICFKRVHDIAKIVHS